MSGQRGQPYPLLTDIPSRPRCQEIRTLQKKLARNCFYLNQVGGMNSRVRFLIVKSDKEQKRFQVLNANEHFESILRCGVTAMTVKGAVKQNGRLTTGKKIMIQMLLHFFQPWTLCSLSIRNLRTLNTVPSNDLQVKQPDGRFDRVCQVGWREAQQRNKGS